MITQNGAGRRRRDDALSPDAVLRTAIQILDESGESGLTFRVLAERLRTGAGAIYWHVTNRRELLDLACDAVLADAGAISSSPGRDEIDTIRAVALALFDALDRHPWAGAHLPSSPGLPSTLRTLDRIGGLLQSFGVPTAQQFYTTTAIFDYVLGVAAQMARNATSAAPGTTQAEWLAERSKEWEQFDPNHYPFLRGRAHDLRDHDDRQQFASGLDLILAGIRATFR